RGRREQTRARRRVRGAQGARPHDADHGPRLPRSRPAGPLAAAGLRAAVERSAPGAARAAAVGPETRIVLGECEVTDTYPTDYPLFTGQPITPRCHPDRPYFLLDGLCQ